MKQTYDVAVIGGGPAGYIAAIKASQLGGRVVLFEKDTVGGTCLNRGCIPTKTYLKTAEYIQHIKHAKTRGIHLKSTDFTLDMGEVVAGKNQVVRQLTGGVAGLLKSYGVDVVKASAGLKSATQVLADGTVYEAKNIILCGGSKAGILPIPGAADNADVVCRTEYCGVRFASMVARGNVAATQFHPEKSGVCGLKILENFTKWQI